MNYLKTLSMVSFCCLAGCSSGFESFTSQGQILPVTAKALVGEKVIDLEVTKTLQQRDLGLMYRTFLPENRGMLFEVDPPTSTAFWMKNCKIPLDMIFLRDNIVTKVEVAAPPCVVEPCPLYTSDVPFDRVIEIQGRSSLKLGIKAGSRIDVVFLN